MRKGLFLLVGLLWGLTSFAQIASPTAFGVIKSGAGLYVDPVSGVMSVTGGTGSGGGGSVYTNDVISQASVQNVVNNAGDNTYIRLKPGNYTWTTELLIANKNGLILDGGGQVTFVGNINTFLKYSGLINNLRVTGIRFASTTSDQTERDGMITTDQSIRGSGYELDHCYFTAPGGNFNAHSWVPVDGRAGQATNSNVFFSIYLHDNVAEDIGRCGFELLNQRLDLARIVGLVMERNVTRRTGLHNQYGMGTSLSGFMRGVRLISNEHYEFTFYGIEVINCKNVTISNNFCESTKPGAAGISVNAQNDDNGGSVINEQVSVLGNHVYTRYSPIQMTDVRNITVMGNEFNNVNSTNISDGACRFVRCTQGKFIGNDAITSSYNALTLDNSSYWIVTGNYLTNKNITDGDAYQVVWLYFSSNCKVLTNNYEKSATKNNLQGNVFEQGGANNTYTQD